MIWGYACPWYQEILDEGEDFLYTRLKTLLRWDLKVT